MGAGLDGVESCERGFEIGFKLYLVKAVLLCLCNVQFNELFFGQPFIFIIYQIINLFVTKTYLFERILR